MADPSIQSFCCHWPNVTETPVSIMQEFNSFSYNVVCLISSLIGILGATYQIYPRKIPKMAHRWGSFSVYRGRQIIIWLAVADLLASSGVFMRSILWLYLQHFEDVEDSLIALMCALISAWAQYFYTATWLWTLCYAVDVQLVLKEREGHPILYHLLAWILPAVLTSAGLLVLYLPDGNCHSLSLSSAFLHILPNYVVTYIPIATVMIANPILYRSATHTVQVLVALNLNQYTNKERKVVTAVKVKFCLINLVFYICWLPNIINGILLWTLWFNLPEKIVIALWYIMALVNPLQALFNCLVYRRWSTASDQLYIPCVRQLSITELPLSNDSPSLGETTPGTSGGTQPGETFPSESTPLLPGTEYNETTSRSINGTDPQD